MDPVTKDPGSKGGSKGCSASKQVVGNRYCNRCNGEIAKECGVWVGLQPQGVAIVCNQPRSVDMGVPHVCYIYICTTVYSISTVFHTAVSTVYGSTYSRASEQGGWRSTIVHYSAQSCPWCHSDYRIGPHLCDVKVLPYCTNR